jgi:GntR family carbon starvation induced transcriptional regulator
MDIRWFTLNHLNMLASTPSTNSSPAGKTQVSALITKLRRDIIAGVLAPDSRLKISEIADRYVSGVIPTREALSRLVSSGLVIAHEQRGFRVAPISSDELHDLASLRKSLETRALRESMLNADIEWETRLIGAHHRMSRLPLYAEEDGLGFAQEWVTAHREFHFALLSGCKSKWLMQFVDVLSDQMNRYRHLSTHDAHGARDVPAEHRALLDAALARDVEAACAMLIEHFSITEENVINTLRQREPVQNQTKRANAR